MRQVKLKPSHLCLVSRHGQEIMADPFIPRARQALRIDDRELARRLGVTVGCLRRWNRAGPPRYAHLALTALIAGLDPDWVVFSTIDDRDREIHPAAALRGRPPVAPLARAAAALAGDLARPAMRARSPAIQARVPKMPATRAGT